MRMAIRFGRIKDESEWETMKPNWKAINKQYHKREGRIMFPTSHDIDYAHIATTQGVLYKLLDAGNSVLITSKPDPQCIKILCDSFKTLFKAQIQFRFTITAFDNDTLKFYEPNAPSFEERFESLKYAFESGFKTSVSIEPYLTNDVRALIMMLAPYCTETIWIGVMRDDIKNHLIKEFDSMREYEGMARFFYINQCEFLRNLYNRESVKKIVESLKRLPLEIRSKVRLKDSIRNMELTL